MANNPKNKNWASTEKYDARCIWIKILKKSFSYGRVPRTKYLFSTGGQQFENDGSLSDRCELSHIVSSELATKNQYVNFEINKDIHNDIKRICGITAVRGRMENKIWEQINSGKIPSIINIDPCGSGNDTIEVAKKVLNINIPGADNVFYVINILTFDKPKRDRFKNPNYKCDINQLLFDPNIQKLNLQLINKYTYTSHNSLFEYTTVIVKRNFGEKQMNNAVNESQEEVNQIVNYVEKFVKNNSEIPLTQMMVCEALNKNKYTHDVSSPRRYFKPLEKLLNERGVFWAKGKGIYLKQSIPNDVSHNPDRENLSKFFLSLLKDISSNRNDEAIRKILMIGKSYDLQFKEERNWTII